MINLSVDDEGIATVTMQRKPVNSINLEFLQEFHKTLDEVEENKCKGMILTSAKSRTLASAKIIILDIIVLIMVIAIFASPTVFSAGMDVTEIYKPDPKRVEIVFTLLQDVWSKLFGSKLVTAAAINGHVPAAGCLLAMSCEWRVMVEGQYKIGLNEVALGVVSPMWFVDSMRNIISQRQTEIAVTTGKMFTVDEALKVGLIDESASGKEEAAEKCKQFIRRFDKIPPMVRGLTKQQSRENALKWLKENRQSDLEDFLKLINTPAVQKTIEMYLKMTMKQ